MLAKPVSSAGRLLALLLVLAVLTACGPQQPPEAPLTAPPDNPILDASPATAVPVVPTPTLAHALIPGELPGKVIANAWDQDSSTTAARKMAPGGDRFSLGIYERPFNSTTMDTYYPDLDITGFSLQQDDTWLYVTILLQEGAAEKGLSGRYGFELDVDVDGQGDFLLLGFTPASTDWSTDGVQIWQDANHNAGNDRPVESNPPQQGDGYELNVFDQGQGSDPDAGWGRISPDNASQVQFALKLSLFNNDPSFTCWAWAGADQLNPALFDLNDVHTQEEAGSPIVGYFYYPLGSLSQIDNTCRVFVGGQLEGNSLGLCGSSVPGQENDCRVRSCPQGSYFSYLTCGCEVNIIY